MTRVVVAGTMHMLPLLTHVCEEMQATESNTFAITESPPLLI